MVGSITNSLGDFAEDTTPVLVTSMHNAAGTTHLTITEPETGEEAAEARDASMKDVVVKYVEQLKERTQHHLGTNFFNTIKIFTYIFVEKITDLLSILSKLMSHIM